MANKEWTDDEVTDEIRKAVAIVNEDRLTAHIHKHFSTPANGANDPKNEPPNSGGNDPPNGDGGKPKRKGSLFWGSEAE